MNATTKSPDQGQFDPFYTPCRYREIMKKYPGLHEFLMKVRDVSGGDVTKAVWTFVVEHFIKTNNAELISGFRPDQGLDTKLPKCCTPSGHDVSSKGGQKTLHEHAVLFWEEVLTRGVQLAHPAARA